jgi:hypothetical protein
MGWKAFIASVIGSLAWPSVIIVLLVILRKQLVGLAERLQEISLPGGAKATFEKQLQAARVIEATSPPAKAEERTADATAVAGERIVPETEESRFLRLVKISPEGAIVDAYKYVEEIIFNEIAPLLGISTTNPAVIVSELVKQDLTDQSTLQLLGVLRQARNVAAHARNGRIAAEEALDYWQHLMRLRSKLNYVLGRLETRKGEATLSLSNMGGNGP